MFDTVIKGGTVVDGTGEPASPATSRSTDGSIAEVGRITGAGPRDDRRRRAARHARLRRHPHPLRRPGHVGRACSRRRRWHGVTTVVMGNCGVGFAPARPDKHDWLIGLMEGVEDIPGTALAEGITWDWETLPRVPRRARRPALDASTSAPRCRTARCAPTSWASGAPRNEPATADDIAAMARLVGEAHRRRRARLLDLAHDRPPGDRRRAGAGHVRGRGRAVRHRRGARRRGHGVLRAGAGRRGRRGPRSRRPRRSTGCAGCRRRSAAGDVRCWCSTAGPRPLARAAGRSAAGGDGGADVVAAGGRPQHRRGRLARRPDASVPAIGRATSRWPTCRVPG